MAERVFLREVRLASINKPLLFYQTNVGNVNYIYRDAALALVKYIEKRCTLDEGWLKDRRVVELGAGQACVGITAACYGANVILTDLEDVVPLLVRTTELNHSAWSERGNVKCLQYTWGCPVVDIVDALGYRPDLVLLSDCIYYEESFDDLVKTLVSLCRPSTEVIICQEITLQNHFAILKELVHKLKPIFKLNNILTTEQDEMYVHYKIHFFKAFKK